MRSTKARRNEQTGNATQKNEASRWLEATGSPLLLGHYLVSYQLTPGFPDLLISAWLSRTRRSRFTRFSSTVSLIKHTGSGSIKIPSLLPVRDIVCLTTLTAANCRIQDILRRAENACMRNVSIKRFINTRRSYRTRSKTIRSKRTTSCQDVVRRRLRSRKLIKSLENDNVERRKRLVELARNLSHNGVYSRRENR